MSETSEQWRAEAPPVFDSGNPWRVANEKGTVAIVVYGVLGKVQSASANAHLISAAPDLLAALKDCREELFKRIDVLTANMRPEVREAYLAFPPIVTADAAIAKAEGRQS